MATALALALAWRRRRLLLVVSRVLLDERRPLRRQLVLREDGRHRALVHAQVAVDARVGVDVKHLCFRESGFILGRMNTVHRAHCNAGRVFGPDAGLRDDVGHKNSCSPTIIETWLGAERQSGISHLTFRARPWWTVE